MDGSEVYEDTKMLIHSSQEEMIKYHNENGGYVVEDDEY